jgi:hypothetical protein
MPLSPEHDLSLRAIGSAHAIVSGDFACCTRFPDLYTKSALDYMKTKRIYGLGALGAPGDDPLLHVFEKVWEAQKSALNEVIGELGRTGIDLIVYKGAEVNERHGRSVPYTFRGDIDVLVRPSDAAKAKRVMGDLGYVQANFDTVGMKLAPIAADRIAAIEKDCYSLVSFARLLKIPIDPRLMVPGVESCYPFYVVDDGILLVVAIDLATGLDQSIPAGPLFDHSIDSPHVGARALRLEEHLWYLCTMFYVQVNQHRHNHKLSQMSDLSLLLSDSHELDWDVVVSKAHKLEILPSMYYTLAYLSALAPKPLIPSSILERLVPTDGSRARDYGWQIHKLLGLVEPLPIDVIPEW